VIGFPCFLGNRLVLGCWNDACVDFVLIRAKCGLLTIRRRDIGPQLGYAFTAPIANMVPSRPEALSREENKQAATGLALLLLFP
jgi:hypothetical protein